MGDPKWEELPFDCLVDIFGRVGVVSLVYEVPYVCKPWYKATLSPLCWKSLIFPNELPGPIPSDDFMNTFAKFVIRRSCGSANVIAFPNDTYSTQEVLKCIGEGFPSLKRLVLGRDVLSDGLNEMLSSVICKWRNLEALEINGYFLNGIIPEISAHCKNFVSLTAIDGNFDESDAHAIVTLLPNLKFLSFKESRIKRSNAVIILKGCKNLVHFDAGLDFDVDDEILKLAAHIPTFKFKAKYSESSDEDYGGNFFDDNERNYLFNDNERKYSLDDHERNYSEDESIYASRWEYDAGLAD